VKHGVIEDVLSEIHYDTETQWEMTRSEIHDAVDGDDASGELSAVDRGNQGRLEGDTMSTPPQVADYEGRLVQLHEEMLNGRRNSPLATSLLNEMNELWSRLDERSMELLDELSEDLYILEDQRRVAELEAGETGDLAYKKAKISFDAGQYRECLAHARKLATLEPKHLYMFGRCWKMLGFGLGAAQFFDRAYRLDKRLRLSKTFA